MLSDRERMTRRRTDGAPSHDDRIGQPLRTLFTLIVHILICLVDDLFCNDFLIGIQRRSERRESHAQGLTSIMSVRVLELRAKNRHGCDVPSRVITPIAPPANPGVRLTTNKCARPV